MKKRVIVIGPRGKMGKLITKIASQRDEIELVGAVAPPNREYCGEDLGQVAMLGRQLGVPVCDNLEQIIELGDVVIDFSTKETSLEVLEVVKRYKKAFVCGTTGFTKEEMEAFRKAGEEIPMLYAANTSKMVNVMKKLLEFAVETLREVDIEILEMHDRWKKDAPSGTSKELGEAMARVLGDSLEDVAIFGREGSGERKKGTIGYHSLRAGNIPSSHTVYLGGIGERLEITHHSYNWECFAIGAVECGIFLANQKAGFYEIKDVLKL